MSKRIKKLSQKEIEALYKRLVAILWSANSRNKFEGVLSDLLTESEEVMLAKRMSIIFLLDQGFSGYRIHKTLKVSQGTVSYIAKKRDTGAYANLQTIFCRKQEKEDMWKYIEVVLRAGLPERGKGRWSSLNTSTR